LASALEPQPFYQPIANRRKQIMDLKKVVALLVFLGLTILVFAQQVREMTYVPYTGKCSSASNSQGWIGGTLEAKWGYGNNNCVVYETAGWWGNYNYNSGCWVVHDPPYLEIDRDRPSIFDCTCKDRHYIVSPIFAHSDCTNGDVGFATATTCG
jgi:hypothetical protein